MNDIEILEKLANNEHIRWANWQKYVHSKCIKNEDGSLTIPKEYVEHWNYEINTKYEDLPENIKESDRKEVREILKILNLENLIQRNKDLEQIEKEHKEENGKLRDRIKGLEKENVMFILENAKYFNKEVMLKEKLERDIEDDNCMWVDNKEKYVTTAKTLVDRSAYAKEIKELLGDEN